MVPSCAGVFSESQHDEDVDMEEGGAKLKHISGYSELRFRRDHMKIVPLYHPEDNTSKSLVHANLTLFSEF